MSLFVNFPFIWQIPVLEISGLKAMCLLHFHRYCQVASQKIIAFALPTVMFESFHFLTLSPALNIISIIYLCLFGGWKLVLCCFYFLEVEHLNFFSFACYVTKLFLLSICRRFLYSGDTNPLSITVLQMFSPTVAQILYPVYCISLNLFMVSLLDSF